MPIQILARCGVNAGAALRRHPLLVLGAAGVIHRILVFVRFRAEIDLLASRLGGLALNQLFPLEVYRGHFLAAMSLLQQTPPFPHLIVKAALLVGPFPVGMPAPMHNQACDR